MHAFDLKEGPADGQLKEKPPARLAVRGISLMLGGRVVLDDVSFEVSPGEIFGLLGPNGSGKTSLMRCLMGLLRPDLGVFWLDGSELKLRQRHLRARMGTVFQEASLDTQLTGRENLLLAARLFCIPRAEAVSRAQELLTFMELAGQGGDLVKTYSGGMRRRLELARALIHRPDLLLMDEPTTGLDVRAVDRVWQRLLAVRRLQGLTAVLTTHSADEAAHCDRLLVLDRGHVVGVDTPESLLSRVGGDVLSIEANEPEELAAAIISTFDLVAEASGDTVTVIGEKLHLLIPRLVEAFPQGRLCSISMRRPTLADAFLRLTGHRLEADQGAAA
jgi:ABC-2 type transport system ATP-binding protein